MGAPQQGRGSTTSFEGWSLFFLAATLFGLAGFALAVAAGWWRGDIPAPREPVLVHPSYKGRIIVRYWYLLVVAFTCLLLAFLWADRGVASG